MRVPWCVLIALATAGLLGSADTATPAIEAQQKAIAAQKASADRMMEAVETQKKSVRSQAEKVRKLPVSTAAPADNKAPAVEPPELPAGEFFTVPWPAPLLSPIAYLDCPELPPAELSRYIRQAAAREGLSPDLLRAVINRESADYPCAVSRKGAMGLMQLMPATAYDLNVGNPFNAQENIDAGSRLLRNLLNRYGNDLSLALGAYNAGPATIDRWGGVPGYPETQNYVSDILGKLGFE
ncbi:MAG: lytic transglycosylase domain-containing protein [Bryobacterales bacterium]|nr:lytic transglycosylase domain-containing protein [Bryobacterales bacterium]